MRRSSEGRVLGGICAGISQTTGIDVTLLRIGVVVVGLFAGFPVLIYALAWLIVPLDTETTNIFSRAIADRRGIRLVIAVIPVVIVTQVVVSLLHVSFVGIISWPVFLAAGLAILIWRNASPPERVWMHNDLVPMLSVGSEGPGRWKLILRTTAGAALAAAGIVVLIVGHPSTAALRPLGGALLVIAAIVVVFGPWWISLVRDLMAEREARALAEERGQMAAHVHDSVLQTLALIQRSADDPQNVVRLARAQERELRAWLFEGRAPGSIGDEVTHPVRGGRAAPAPRRGRSRDHGPGGDGGGLSPHRRPARPPRCGPGGHGQLRQMVRRPAGLALRRGRARRRHAVRARSRPGVRSRLRPRRPPGDRPVDPGPHGSLRWHGGHPVRTGRRDRGRAQDGHPRPNP